MSGCSSLVFAPGLLTAKCRDLHRQIAVLDDDPRPHLFDDLVAGDELARPREQNSENFERTRADRDRNKAGVVIAPREAMPVETEALEQESFGGGGGVDARSPLESMSKAGGGPPLLGLGFQPPRFSGISIRFKSFNPGFIARGSE